MNACSSTCGWCGACTDEAESSSAIEKRLANEAERAYRERLRRQYDEQIEARKKETRRAQA